MFPFFLIQKDTPPLLLPELPGFRPRKGGTFFFPSARGGGGGGTRPLGGFGVRGPFFGGRCDAGRNLFPPRGDRPNPFPLFYLLSWQLFFPLSPNRRQDYPPPPPLPGRSYCVFFPLRRDLLFSFFPTRFSSFLGFPFFLPRHFFSLPSPPAPVSIDQPPFLDRNHPLFFFFPLFVPWGACSPLPSFPYSHHTPHSTSTI